MKALQTLSPRHGTAIWWLAYHRSTSLAAHGLCDSHNKTVGIDK